ALEMIEARAIDTFELQQAAADTLRRMGEAGRALAMLRANREPQIHAQRAEIARRAGDGKLAESEAMAALACDPHDPRARAVLARLLIDQGQPRGALAALAEARPSEATSEARAIALIAAGDRASAESELAICESLAESEEARGRVAGLVGYVAHDMGDI